MEIDMTFRNIFNLLITSTRHMYDQYRLATSETRVICTENGRIRGLQRKTIYDEEPYYAFEGIPFAKPPLGELRFRAPQPPESWPGVRDCTYSRDKPTQVHCALWIAQGSEDCLHLNVYTKTLNSSKPLPVIVWLYGGGFEVGENTRDLHGPDYFMKKNVVLVIPNSRVGALGFLSMSDPEIDVPGNAGLKDQVMALRWIQTNIRNFNGDPNNVTLLGLSSGAVAVQILMSTPQTRGLFHKAIQTSGSSLCSWSSVPNKNWSYRLACHLGYTGNSDNQREILSFLQRATPQQLAGSYTLRKKQGSWDDITVLPFGPIVEPYITESCVISRPHVEALSTAWGNGIPVIIGCTSFEGLFFYQYVRKYARQVLRQFDILIPREVRESSSSAEVEEYVKRIKRFIFEDAARDRMEFKEMLRLLSITYFQHPMHRTILARKAYATTVPTYLYRFDFDSPHYNFFRNLICGYNETGVTHADDLVYMFYSIVSFKLDKASPEYRTIETLIGMLTAFATSNDPNCTEIQAVKWEPLQPNVVPNCLNIGRSLEIIEFPENKRLKFWDSFYNKLKLI